MLSSSGEAEVGRANQDHAQILGPPSMHIHGIGIMPALSSEDSPGQRFQKSYEIGTQVCV